jgi:hypothetical protein
MRTSQQTFRRQLSVPHHGNSAIAGWSPSMGSIMLRIESVTSDAVPHMLFVRGAVGLDLHRPGRVPDVVATD